MKRRTALLGGAVAAAAVAGGIAGRAVLRRRGTPAADAYDELPPEDLGPVRAADGTELCLRAAGDRASPVLLFVHGFSLDMTVWHPQWTVLRDRFRCVLLDLRAHGRSGPAADLSLGAMAGDVASALEAAAPGRRAVVVGHSMGAMASLALAAARPELFGPRIAGLVLVGAAAGDLVRGAVGGLAEILRPGRSLAEALRRVDGLRRHLVASRADVGALLARLTQFGPHAPRAAVEHVVALAARAPSTVWTNGLASLVGADLRNALAHVRVPVLVVVGDHDRVTPRAAAEALVRALPRAELAVLEGAGHVPMLERPEALNALIEGFASRVLGGEGSG